MSNLASPAAVVSNAAFGSVFGPSMSVSYFNGSTWTSPALEGVESFALHPATHALHYGSSCFEGLKAHRHPNGSVLPFRADVHMARLRQSAARLCLPVPPTELAHALIDEVVAANAELTPDSPGALYLRPTLLGTDVTIGAAAHPSETAILYVLASPVGEYLPPRPLTIVVETDVPRTTPQFGVVKTGANYAMALSSIEAERHRHGADQVLFAPDGILQETGASNVMLIDGPRILTPALTDAFLHGVTRDSLLRVATARGWQVEERDVDVAECIQWISESTAELALTGTAAVVAPVGTLVVDGTPHNVGTPGRAGSIDELRAALVDVQTGRVPFDW